jgi:hypothetical protein
MSEAGTSQGNDRAAMLRFAGSHETRWESQTLVPPCLKLAILKLAHRELPREFMSAMPPIVLQNSR